jgi:hypothetical protein
MIAYQWMTQMTEEPEPKLQLQARTDSSKRDTVLGANQRKPDERVPATMTVDERMMC